MNTLHLSTIGVAIGSAGMLAASALPGAAANVAKTVNSAEKNQSTITNYVDNQSNSNYTKHNRTSMDQAWNYFNPLNYGSSSSTTTGSGVNPGGPVNAGTETDSSTTTGTSGTSASGSTGTTTTGTPDSSSSDTSTTGATAVPKIPSPLRRIIMADVTNTLHKIKEHWHGTSSDSNWTPTGANWQADWSNWNPILWEQNGSSYANWAKQLGTYLSSRFPNYASEIKEAGL